MLWQIHTAIAVMPLAAGAGADVTRSCPLPHGRPVERPAPARYHTHVDRVA